MGRKWTMPKTIDARSAGDDRLLGRDAMRGVRPLLGREAAISPSPAVVEHPAQSDRRLSLDRFTGIDRANAERLKRGRHPIEARLDLHGLTQAEAHRALVAFV